MHYKLKTNDFFFEKKINTMQATKHMYTVYHVKEVPVTSHWPRVLGVQIAYNVTNAKEIYITHMLKSR